MTKEEQGRSIFRIMDGIMEQVEKTRKIFMLIIAVIIPSGMIVLAIVVFDVNVDELHNEGDVLSKVILPIVILIITGFGIRQLLILNRWTKKYKEFKEEQENLDKKFDKMEKE